MIKRSSVHGSGVTPVGPDHASREGQEAIAFQASLYPSNEVESGEYEITEGFSDVGSNAVPVSAMAVAAKLA